MSVSLISPPSITQVAKAQQGQKGKHAVRFVMNFVGEKTGIFSVGAFPSIYGDQYTFQPQALGPVELGTIKAIQVSAFFASSLDGGQYYPGGDYFIVLPSTGQILQIAGGVFSQSEVTSSLVCGCFAVESIANSPIQFIKGTQTDLSTMNGVMAVTLFDYEVQPWVLPATQNFISGS